MTLTTAGLDGMPEARTVFLKSFKEDGFFFLLIIIVKKASS